MNLRKIFWPTIVPLALAITGLCPRYADAQLPSQNRFSPINYFGRFSGFGYSDGYHACKDGRCSSGSLWKPWESVSSFYGEPTLPPVSPLFRGSKTAQVSSTPQLNAHQYYESVHPYSQSQFATPQSGVQSNQAPYNPGSFGQGMSSPSMPPAELIAPQSAQQMAPAPTNTAPNFYETVPPAPLRKPESPSNKDFFELPMPSKSSDDLLPAVPSVQSRRVPPGTQSLLHQSHYRKR